MIGATVALFAFTWVAFSPPEGYGDLLYAAFYLWVLLGLVWLIWLIVLLVRSRICIPAQSCRRLSHFPVFVALMGLAIWLHAPLWLGYLVSRPTMDRTAHAVLSGKRDPSKISWVGIYPVSEASWNGNEVEFIVSGTDFNWGIDTGGFAYSSEPVHLDEYQHLSGHWYRVDRGPCECGA